MNAQMGMSPLRRYLWLPVLAIGIAASIGTYIWLHGMDVQIIRHEMIQRSQIKLATIHSIFQQHFDTAKAIDAFIKGEMGGHEYVDETEAHTFARALLNIHPDELAAVAIIPPEGSGEAVMLRQEGAGRLDPPPNKQRLQRLTPGVMDVQLVQNKERRWRIRVSTSSKSGSHAGYSISDWNTTAMIDIAIAGTPRAGLDIETGLIKNGQFTRIYRHRSRLRKAEEEEEEEMTWRGAFLLDGINFEVRTRAVPTVLRRLTSPSSVWALLLGLLISLLLAYLTYNRSRYGERLRREVEERSRELSAERQMLRTIMDHAPVGIWSLRKDGQMIFINQAFCAATGVDEQAFLNARHYKDVLDHDTARQCMTSDEIAMKQDNPVKSVEQILFADGKRHPMEVLKVRIAGSDGEPARLIGIGQDITERLAHEQVLEGERRKLASVIDHANETILLMDDQGAILRANPAASKLFGYGPDEWRGLSVHGLVPVEIREPHVQWFTEEMAGKRHDIMGKTRELRGRRKDGSIFPCEVTVNEFQIGKEKRLSVILRDLTEHRQREWSQKTLLQLRTASQGQEALTGRLQKMLDCMFGDPWGFLCNTGAIFLVKGEVLNLAANHGWTEKDKKRCASVPFGECLCGKAVANGEAIFSPHRPQEHRLSERGGPDAGYLCTPVMHGDERLGLINFKLRPGVAIPDAFRSFCRQAEEIMAEMLLRERAREALKESEHKYRSLVESTNAAAWHLDFTSGRFIYMGPQIEKLTGYPAGSWKDFDSWSERIHPEDREQAVQYCKTCSERGENHDFEYRIVTPDGENVWIRDVVSITSGERGEKQLIGYMFDISKRKQAEEKLDWLSYYDELTELPNRRLFADRMEQALALARREKRPLALLFLDLDRFKMINDSLGHASGDLVLKESASRLTALLRKSDSAARMGGDEFTVLLPEADVSTAMRVAEKIGVALRKPHRLSGQDITLGVSIGIAIFPDDGADARTMLMHADTAMYHAKKNPSHIHYFSIGMEEQAKKRLRMEQDLAKAVDENQLKLYFQSQHAIRTSGKTSPFPLHYQAKHQLADGAIIGMEGLIRWQHPELGSISPAEFIPLAEETGLIRPITHWVLAEACMQATAWEKAGIRPGRIGVNLSAIQLMQKGLAKEILARVREMGVSPEWIEIEITETAVMTDPETAIAIMRKLVDSGISIAIDDFGTGYSSLAYLKRLPAEWLKIDIAFIRALPDDTEDAAIVRSTIVMAHALGMKVIAEGVETKAQLEFLRGEGCDAVQGYLLSKPLPADEATTHIKRHIKS